MKIRPKFETKPKEIVGHAKTKIYENQDKV